MESDGSIDWSKFQISMPISMDQDLIKKAWSTPEQLQSWFLRKAEFTDPQGHKRSSSDAIVQGDSYKWWWHGWPDSVIEQGVLLAPTSKEFMRFTFGKAGIVSLGFSTLKGVDLLILNQEKIPTDEKSRMNYHVGCKTGWTFYLTNLNSVLQGGPDLRNKNPELNIS